MLLIDGVRYYLHPFKEEKDLEGVFREHAKDVFGAESIYFDKKKISSLSGVGCIPDGYAVSFGNTHSWYVVEIELSSHPTFNHVVSQVTRFTSGIGNDQTKRELIKYFDTEIRSQVAVARIIKERFGEVYKFVSELIYREPTIVVVVEEKS